jgi:hypothetical protein
MVEFYLTCAPLEWLGAKGVVQYLEVCARTCDLNCGFSTVFDDTTYLPSRFFLHRLEYDISAQGLSEDDSISPRLNIRYNTWIYSSSKVGARKRTQAWKKMHT